MLLSEELSGSEMLDVYNAQSTQSQGRNEYVDVGDGYDYDIYLDADEHLDHEEYAEYVDQGESWSW